MQRATASKSGTGMTARSGGTTAPIASFTARSGFRFPPRRCFAVMSGVQAPWGCLEDHLRPRCQDDESLSFSASSAPCSSDLSLLWNLPPCREIEFVHPTGFADPDERTGAQIVVRALEEPLRQLAYNAGLEGSVVVNKVRTAAKGQDLNVDTNEIEDLVKAGIIDPTMVTRSALQNAASIAKNILMTEAIVAEPPEKAGAGMGGMGDMGGMM
jgi:TCP-1/cpn60 chaperonin family